MEQWTQLQSDFKIVGNFAEEKTSLQRTDDWLEERRGRFTGSRIDDLMKCGKSTAKMRWGAIEKTIDFGSTAEKYIYQVGKERKTGLLGMNVSSKQMEHGTNSEPKLIDQLLKDGVITDFIEKGFEKFAGYDNGGASVDGICTYKNEQVGLELKCTVSWDGHFGRMYEAVHEKHDDFWQMQSEMLATGVKKILYVVAMPMQVEKYDVRIVNASPTHQKEILRRCMIADVAIDLWDDHDYPDALAIACANFKINSI